jgi:hypothetical protein
MAPGRLEGECTGHPFASCEREQPQIFDFVEVWHNRQREPRSLDHLSPAEFERPLGSGMSSVHGIGVRPHLNVFILLETKFVDQRSRSIVRSGEAICCQELSRETGLRQEYQSSQLPLFLEVPNLINGYSCPDGTPHRFECTRAE